MHNNFDNAADPAKFPSLTRAQLHGAPTEFALDPLLPWREERPPSPPDGGPASESVTLAFGATRNFSGLLLVMVAACAALCLFMWPRLDRYGATALVLVSIVVCSVPLGLMALSESQPWPRLELFPGGRCVIRHARQRRELPTIQRVVRLERRYDRLYNSEIQEGASELFLEHGAAADNASGGEDGASRYFPLVQALSGYQTQVLANRLAAALRVPTVGEKQLATVPSSAFPTGEWTTI